MSAPSGSQCDYTYKIIVIGDVGTGKTALVQRCGNEKFTKDYIPTIGVDFLTWDATISDSTVIPKLNQPIVRKNVRLFIWDTAGQEKFKSIVKSYYRNAVGALIVFDLSSTNSFESISEWVATVLRESPIEARHILLVGNKSDKQSVIPQETIDELVRTRGLAGYIATSAEEGVNVQEAFTLLAQKIHNTYNDLTLKDTKVSGIKKNYVSPIQIELTRTGRHRSGCC